MPSKASRAKVAESTSPEPERVDGIEGKTGTIIEDEKILKAVKDTGIKLVDAELKSPYPEGARLFSWQPKNGGPVILLPLEFERPNKMWLWSMHRQPFLSQTWAWMDRANVPDSVQIMAQAIPDDEYLDMFTAWIKAMGGGATPGES